MCATSPSRRRRNKTPARRAWRIARWITIAGGGVLVTLAIIAAAGSRSSTLRRLGIDTLSGGLDSDVPPHSFGVDFFPPGDGRGEGLVVQLRGHADMPPLLKIKGF